MFTPLQIGRLTGKPRPVVIVQDDWLEAIASATVCPMTTNLDRGHGRRRQSNEVGALGAGSADRMWQFARVGGFGLTDFEADVTARLAATEYRQAVESYVDTEVRPWVSDAWVDHAKTRIGYEIPLTRHFYRYTPPRPLAEIDAEIKQLEAEIQALLADVTD